MPERIYLDANIYLDYFLDRSDNLRPLGEFAGKVLKEAVSCKFFVLVSPDVIREIRNTIRSSEEKVWSEVLFDLKNASKIIFVESNSLLDRKAEQFSEEFGLPLIDSLHLLLAAENNAVLITRDRHFDCVKEKFNVLNPEELLFSV